MIDPIQLTKDLIHLPSFVDETHTEKPVSDFIVAFANQHLPWMRVEIQEVALGRVNILLFDQDPVKLLVIDQLDTVVPDPEWKTDPLDPIEEDGKIIGLGASDSKGNIASFLSALVEHGPTRGLGVLFYVDEEYLFSGMKHFVQSPTAQHIQPQTILSIDGNGSMLGLGCRGVMEFEFHLKTPSGHSAHPNGMGAIRLFQQVYAEFELWIQSFKDSQLGGASVHIARLNGGFQVGGTDHDPEYGSAGNRLANRVDAKIEVRTVPGLSFDVIQEYWREQIKNMPNSTLELDIVFDLSGFSTSRDSVSDVVHVISDHLFPMAFLDPSTFGYLDISMLSQVYPQARLCSFGIGEPGTNHKAGEYVLVDALKKGVLVYFQILQKLIGGTT